MDIIEKEDERTFEEKKKEAINFLKDKENTLLAERLMKHSKSPSRAGETSRRKWR